MSLICRHHPVTNTANGKKLGLVLVTVFALCLPGCGSSEDAGDDQSADTTLTQAMKDSIAIQESLTEAAVRLGHQDLGVLYDFEFEYFQHERNFDEYIEHRFIRGFGADSMKSMVVTNIVFYDRDSADAKVDVIFVGPTGKTSIQKNNFRMFYHRGRWIKPTMSQWSYQQEFQKMCRAADSAASAESEEDW